MDQVDCVVIGAGVVGLAVARALALQGREVMVLESASAIGTGTSSRNSEVIHAGIYYPAGSLKARLCVQGKALLYAYCAERGVGHRRCGKLIVATAPAQVAALQGIVAKAAANGVHDLVLLSREEAQALEPQLECVAAIHSPSTGIVDSHALMLALQGDLENAGGLVALNSGIKSAVALTDTAQGAIELIAEDGTALRATTVVNAAGLHAPALAARIQGLDARQAHAALGHVGAKPGVLRRIGRQQLLQREDQDRDEEQRRDQLQQPLSQEGEHLATLLPRHRGRRARCFLSVAARPLKRIRFTAPRRG